MRLCSHPVLVMALALGIVAGCSTTGRVSSNTGEATFTIDAPPDAPCSPAITLTGTKERGVEIFVAGAPATVGEDDATWSAEVTLEVGANTIVVRGVLDGDAHVEEVAITYDESVPEAPTVSAPAATTDASAQVTGTKAANVGIAREGAAGLVVPVDAQTTFSDPVSLSLGDNTFVYRAENACGRQSAAVQVRIVREEEVIPGSGGAVVTFPADGALVGDTVVVRGTATHDDGVHSVSVCVGACASASDFTAATGTASFEATVDTSSLDASLDGTVVDVVVRVAGMGAGAGAAEVTPSQVYLLRRPRAISGDAAFSDRSESPDIAAGSSAVFIVFQDASIEQDDDVYLVVQDGSAFSTTAVVASAPNTEFANSNEPRVAHDDVGGTHVVWLDDGPVGSDQSSEFGLVHRELSTNGEFSAVKAVVRGSTGQGVSDPDAAISGSHLAAVWNRAGVIELSVYDGTSWATAVDVTNGVDTDSASSPRLAVSSDGTVHVVWKDEGNEDGDGIPDEDIYYRRHGPSGSLSPVRVVSVAQAGTLEDGRSTRPAIAAVPGAPDHTVFVAWLEVGTVGPDTSDSAKAVARALDDGVVGDPPAFGQLLNVSDVAGHDTATRVDIAADADGNFTVVWVDRRGNIDGEGADRDVFERRYDGTLQPVRVVSGASDEDSNDPAVAMDPSGNTHIAWEEQSDLDSTVSGVDDEDVMYFGFGLEQ